MLIAIKNPQVLTDDGWQPCEIPAGIAFCYKFSDRLYVYSHVNGREVRAEVIEDAPRLTTVYDSAAPKSESWREKPPML